MHFTILFVRRKQNLPKKTKKPPQKAVAGMIQMTAFLK